jgi:hypothetical protein
MKYNIMGMCIDNPFYGNVDLHYPTWIVLLMNGMQL